MSAKEGESRQATEQLNDMNKIITSMEENKAKFAKSCDNDSLREIKGALLRGSCPLGEEILDNITQFLTGNTKATFKNDGGLYFENETAFALAVKKCDAAKNEKEWIRGVADSVNMDAEGQKGKILKGISDAAESKNLIPFFPYFKVLFKLCQIGMTMKSKQSKQRREEEASKTMANLQVNVETQEALIENLAFRDLIEDEVKRSQDQELAALMNKRQQLEAQIRDLQAYENKEAFLQDYFSGL